MNHATELEVILGTMAVIIGTAAVVAGIAWGMARWHRRQQVKEMRRRRMTFGALREGHPLYTRCECGALHMHEIEPIACRCGLTF